MPRAIRLGVALSLMAGSVALGSSVVFRAPQAQAACHIAAFEESAYSVDETAGSVTVTVFLEGRQPECSGSVEVATVDGSATAPEDYEAMTQVLCFQPADDREEDVQIAIADDLAAEGNEQFAVQLSDANEGSCQPDGITGNATTTVTIIDNDTPQQPQPEPTQAPAPTPAPQAATTPTPEATPTPSPSPTSTPTPSPSPTAIAVEDEEDAGSNTGLIAAAVAAVALAGTGAGLLFWRRRAV